MSRLPGIGRIRFFVRSWSASVARRAPHGIVLLYHRIAGPRFDPLLLDVSAANFAAHLDALKSEGTVLPLDEFERLRRAGELPPRASTITFDDGYADNLHAAAPLLAAARLPARVFVTSGMVGSEGEFWWDDAERIVTAPALEGPMPVDGIPWSGDDGRLANETPWNLETPGTPTRRRQLFLHLTGRLQRLGAPQRARAMAAMREWARIDAKARPSHRTLTSDELRDLATRPGITIGAHTVTHACLAALRWQEQLEELTQSRVALESVLGSRVDSVAFPFGTAADISDASVQASIEAGFDTAYANEPRVAWRGTPQHRIPRILVRDWPVDDFMARVRRWWSGWT
jgi:peptidoglycan/xylan/chitin deacetylase (PgdA/CDA1 family)